MTVSINKARGFELLRKKGAVKAELTFSGGHDEGSVEAITLTNEAGAEEDLELWYAEYKLVAGEYVLSDPATENQELSVILQQPIDETFGSWASVEYTSGTLTWDVLAGTVAMDYEQDEPIERSETF